MKDENSKRFGAKARAIGESAQFENPYASHMLFRQHQSRTSPQVSFAERQLALVETIFKVAYEINKGANNFPLPLLALLIKEIKCYFSDCLALRLLQSFSFFDVNPLILLVFPFSLSILIWFVV